MYTCIYIYVSLICRVNINLLAANILGKIPKLVGYYLLSESGANPFVPIGNTTLNREKGIGEKAYFT